MFKISFKPLTSELSLCIDLMMRPAYLCQEQLTEMKNTSTWWTNEAVYEEFKICNMQYLVRSDIFWNNVNQPLSRFRRKLCNKRTKQNYTKYENKIINLLWVMQTGLSSIRSLVSAVSHIQPILSNCLLCYSFIPDLPKYSASVQKKNGYNH